VVGGGVVGARKIRGLLAAGFEVTLVSPTLLAGLDGLDFAHERRKFQLKDIARHGIVFACTNDRSVNEKVGQIARMAGKPVVVADRPEESTAFSTAVFREGFLQVGVSTAASAPGMATEVRDRIAETIKGEFGDRIATARKEHRAGPG
jgi:cobalt-precorrin 5A hydrolase / cobalt-factor III methyltransferase / precorrin-3B C17-methyltransferase